MKTRVNIGIHLNDFWRRNIIDEFRQLFSFGCYGAGFQVSVQTDDPRIEDVLVAFRQKGISKVNYSGNAKAPRPPVEYILEYRRTYEPEDFEKAAYLKLKHEVLITEDQERDGQGRLLLPMSKLKPVLKIGCVLFQASVVHDSVRRKMVNAGLVGLQFNEIITDGNVSSDFWELVSPVTLPQMPRERLVCREISPGDYQNVAGIRDGDFLEKEIHYPAAAVGQIEPFDFALTHEIFGGERWPIISQRFRQFCLAHKLNVSGVPVRLD